MIPRIPGNRLVRPGSRWIPSRSWMEMSESALISQASSGWIVGTVPQTSCQSSLASDFLSVISGLVRPSWW